MAKNRMVNTRFWDDSYIVKLNPSEKLLFLYLLTCPLTTIAGVYELSARRASFDTGVSMEEIELVFQKFESDRKVIRKGDWVLIVNFIRHQTLNPKVKQGIVLELGRAPGNLVSMLPDAIHSLCIGTDFLLHPNPNSFQRDTNNKASESGGRIRHIKAEIQTLVQNLSR